MHKNLKRELECPGDFNQLFFEVTSEEMSEVQEFLKNDNNLLNVIVDFTDLERLNSLIQAIPSDLDKDRILYYIYEQYFCYQILRQIDLPEFLDWYDITDLQDFADKLFSGDYEKFISMNFIDFSSLEEEVTKKARKMNKKVRLHLYLDMVHDISLQQYINIIIAGRYPMMVMGYSSSETLITYQDSMGRFIEDIHDYCSYYPEEHYARIREKYHTD